MVERLGLHWRPTVGELQAAKSAPIVAVEWAGEFEIEDALPAIVRPPAQLAWSVAVYLRSIASAFPEQSVTQIECAEMFRKSPYPAEILSSQRSLDIVHAVLTGDSGISKRHFAIEDIPSVLQFDAGKLNRAFEEHAPSLATAALTKALAKSGTAPSELDGLFICTCTGYLCPGVSSYVAESLGLRSDVVLHDVVGLGCGAAIPTLRSASNYLTAEPDATVAVIAVEVCSSAFFLADDPGVLISMCLFGDGASASIWKGREESASMLRAHTFRSRHFPEDREKIRFVNDFGKLRNKLHRSVPAVTANAVADMFAEVPAPSDPSRPMRAITHTGGRDVLIAIREKLPQFDLAESTHVLDQYGNLSSPSVLVALEHYLEETSPAEKENLFMAAFGAGFACHTCWAET